MRGAAGLASIITAHYASRSTDSWSPKGRRFPPHDLVAPLNSKCLPYPVVTDPEAPRFFRPLGGAPDRCRAYLDAGKARAQNFVGAFAPCDRPPSMFRQRKGQTLGADPRPQLAPPQYRLDLNCWNDSNHIAEPQFAYAGAQLGVGTVARIVQHDTARYAGRTSSAQLVERNLRLGLEFDLLGNTRLLAALDILGPFLRQIQPIGDRQAGMFIGNR